MGIRVLIVEDRDIRYEPLLEALQAALPAEAFQFTRVATMTAAVEAFEQEWDVILMDYHLGKRVRGKDKSRIDSGADLVRYRRRLEAADPKRKRAQIIGAAGAPESGEKIIAAGGDLDCCGHARGRPCVIKHLRAWLPGEE